jgi:hypothetical protein
MPGVNQVLGAEQYWANFSCFTHLSGSSAQCKGYCLNSKRPVSSYPCHYILIFLKVECEKPKLSEN